MATPDASPRSRRWWLPARADLLIAGGVSGLAAAFVVVTGALTTRPTAGMAAAATAAAAVVAAPLLRARDWPVASAVTVAVAFHLIGPPYGARVGVSVLPPDQAEAWEVSAVIAYLLAVLPLAYLVSRHRPPWAVAATLIVVAVPTNVLASIKAGLSWTAAATGSSAVLMLVTVALAPLWITGGVRRRNARQTARLAEQNAALTARAVHEERARIARELQGLVLSDLAVITEHAGGAPATDDELRDVLTTIAATGRDTLTAMRRLLGMLRGDDGGVPGPQPSLAQLDGLILGLREQGMAVTVSVSGPPRLPAAEVDLAAYRLVQEVLNSASRETPVELRVAYEPDAIRLTVDGNLGRAGGAAAREWVRLVGGELRIGRGDEPALEVRLPERRKGAVWTSAS
jgi:signal transduction histidine kinase